MFCASGLVFGGTEGVGSRFMFCAPGLVFGGNEGAGYRFHVLCSWSRFLLSSFALLDSFSAVSRASTPVLIFGARTRFRQYRGRRVPFSCFALPDSVSAIMRASGLVFLFCALGHVFDGMEGVRSRFHVLRALAHFRRK
jgi:hypothetical protein